MLNYGRMAIMAAAVLAAVSGLFFILKIEIASGIMAGYLTGIISFTALVFTVKILLKDPKNNSVRTAVAAVLVYLTKIAVIGGVLILLIVYRKYFDLRGFLAGFTISLLILLAENGIVLFVNFKK